MARGKRKYKHEVPCYVTLKHNIFFAGGDIDNIKHIYLTGLCHINGAFRRPQPYFGCGQIDIHQKYNNNKQLRRCRQYTNISTGINVLTPSFGHCTTYRTTQIQYISQFWRLNGQRNHMGLRWFTPTELWFTQVWQNLVNAEGKILRALKIEL